MKKLITVAIVLSSLMTFAQFPKEVRNRYEPNAVQYAIQKSISDSLSESEVNKIVEFENFRYTYDIKQFKLADSTFVSWNLVKKEKLYYRPFTVLGIEAFGTCMGTMLFFGSIDAPKDKKLHALAGWCITGATSTVMYYWTGKKWVSVLVGLAAGCLAGIAKEAIWDKGMGKGICDNKDAYTTIGGAFASAVTVRITLK